MTQVCELFGSMVFNDRIMQERLPKSTYKTLKKAIQTQTSLDLATANVIANAMKDWALEKGVTHFTHWFQPMTGITAEKHDSFISPTGDGHVIMEFSGKELIKGEPDASSFPSGGLRATFEARGYTAWDPSSYAFIKDGILCIPTAFCSYGGHALDKKTPLLRSMQVINTQALRILRLFGHDEVSQVITTVGPEQEYFLIDKSLYDQRKDLIFCNRTLFGARPPKGQELEDHYFGAIKPRVASYMKELDEELWKLGVLAKTKHNEVAPSQHELAPIFTTTNIATDHNQLTMETMKKVALKHNLVCLLHEKPFAGVNGSGKHNNWSLSTDTGMNLLEPGDSPEANAQFLLFLTAVVKAVDDYQDLLRISVASAGNDHRLGANEAPPAIVSIFLGDELTSILECIESGCPYNPRTKEQLCIGADILPIFPKDTTDRNRTSPFAFTGNKFEFRMLGSTHSISGSNIILNTIVAKVLDDFASKLENATDFTDTLNTLICETIKNHKRIIFNGNNYSEEWAEEANRRGLLNLKTTPDALPYFVSEKNMHLFTSYGIFTEAELHSRYEILLENYTKTLSIEALTMLDMARKDILPAVCSYIDTITQVALHKKQLLPNLSCHLEETLVTNLSSLVDSLYDKVETLDNAFLSSKNITDSTDLSLYFKTAIIPAMQSLRIVVDELEMLVGRKYWPYPTYSELLFSV
ncbi:MAG: glutamine synthetase III [Cellulosilyticaceae bacterium]